MKIFKRVIAVILLGLTAAVVGYLVYTGSRLTAQSDSGEPTQNEVQYEQETDF